MRWALLVGVAVLAAGCGCGRQAGDEKVRAEMANVETTCAQGISCGNYHFRPFRRCTHVSRGFRACTTFFELKDDKSAIYRTVAGRWMKVAGPLRGRVGWWRRVIAAPRRSTLLAQWSGECEIQSTYLVSVGDGTTRPILEGLPSSALGWAADGRARVLLPAPFWGTRAKRVLEAGIYRVDPTTLAVTLERSLPRRRSC